MSRTVTGVASSLHPGIRWFETYWSSGRAAEALAPTYALLDMTVYGRQETWENSPPGWPQLFGTAVSSSAPTAAPPLNGHGWRPGAPATSGAEILLPG